MDAKIVGEMLAMKALLPHLIGHIAQLQDRDPDEFVRELHASAQHSLDTWQIEGSVSTRMLLREAASTGLDGLLSGLKFTR